MTPEVKDLLDANFSARNLDRQFLNELRRFGASLLQTRMGKDTVFEGDQHDRAESRMVVLESVSRLKKSLVDSR